MVQDFENDVIRIVMTSVAEYGFAIAGGRAAVFHEIVDRPTEDLDAFSNRFKDDVLPSATAAALEALNRAGFEVNLDTEVLTPLFSRIYVRSGPTQEMRVELGYDWREHEPVVSDYGPVIDIRDFAASKMSALWGRVEVRDVIDVHGLLTAGSFTKAELVRLLKENDAGFDEHYFLQRLRAASQHRNEEFEAYGVSAETAQAIRGMFATWATNLATSPTHKQHPPQDTSSGYRY